MCRSHPSNVRRCPPSPIMLFQIGLTLLFGLVSPVHDQNRKMRIKSNTSSVHGMLESKEKLRTTGTGISNAQSTNRRA